MVGSRSNCLEIEAVSKTASENRVLNHQIREQGENKLIYPPKTLRNTVCGAGRPRSLDWSYVLNALFHVPCTVTHEGQKAETMNREWNRIHTLERTS